MKKRVFVDVDVYLNEINYDVKSGKRFGNNTGIADPLFEIVLVFSVCYTHASLHSQLMHPLPFSSLYSGGCLPLTVSLGFLAIIDIIQWELFNILNDALLLFINTYKLLG